MPQIITTMGYQTHGKQLLSKGTWHEEQEVTTRQLYINKQSRWWTIICDATYGKLNDGKCIQYQQYLICGF
jgi:hypothetical protein